MYRYKKHVFPKQRVYKSWCLTYKSNMLNVCIFSTRCSLSRFVSFRTLYDNQQDTNPLQIKPEIERRVIPDYKLT